MRNLTIIVCLVLGLGGLGFYLITKLKPATTPIAISASQTPPTELTLPPTESFQISDSLFVVTPNYYAESLSGDSAKFGQIIISEFIQASKSGESYAPGKTYNLYSGGHALGKVIVKSKTNFQCDSEVGIGEVPPNVKIEKGSFMLAGNSSKIKADASRRSALSLDEQTKFMSAAINYLNEHSISIDKAAQSTVDRAFLITSNSGQRMAVGSISMKNGGKVVDLFMIAEIKNNDFKASFADADVSVDDDDEGVERTIETFVDNLDVDGHGIDEIVTVKQGYESEQFYLYKSTASGWKAMASGGGGGC